MYVIIKDFLTQFFNIPSGDFVTFLLVGIGFLLLGLLIIAIRK